MRSIAFFDFDGTLTTKDAFLYFLTFAVKRIPLLFGMALMSPVIFLYLTKIISNSRAKEIIFSWFFSGMSIEKFEALCVEFNQKVLPAILKKEAMNKLRWHVSSNHEVVVVSANFDLILNTWCKENGIKLISTCVETKDGNITGKFSGKNCYGTEKVNRITGLYELKEYNHIYAYGDSKGDLPMLQLANYPFYRTF